MINKIYFNKEVLEKIKLVFEENGSIQLSDFFNYEFEFKNIKFKRENIPQSYSYFYSNFANKELNKELVLFLQVFLNNKVNIKNLDLFCFGHRDYTLLNDKFDSKNKYKIIIDFTKSWNEEFGGYHSFIRNNEEFLRLQPKFNSFSIIKLDKKTKYFVKYINNKAKENKRYFIGIKL